MFSEHPAEETDLLFFVSSESDPGAVEKAQAPAVSNEDSVQDLTPNRRQLAENVLQLLDIRTT